MLARRILGLSKRVQFAVQFSAARIHSTINPCSVLPGSPGFLCRFGSGSSWKKQHTCMLSGIILFGQTALFLGLNGSPALAEESSVVDNDQGQGVLAGLRRIEDGSVISNSHTSKWRIFTDNGRELFLKGKLDEAEKYFLLALQEAKEGFGIRDPHVASSCNNLAELYRVRKAFEKAEPLYLEAIIILEESFGTDDIRVGAALHNLGQFYLVQRKLEQARACYERALKIEGRVLGYNHTEYANTMYHLGTVLHLQGKEKDSEALVKESIRILEEGGQGETMTCIRRMRYLSQMLLKSNRLVDAENLQRKILHILEISKGWDSLDTVVAAEGLALTLQSLGNLQDAQEIFQRCLDVRKNILAEDHIQIAANMLHLARIALLKSNQLRKLKIADARAEAEKAKLLLDDSISYDELSSSPKRLMRGFVYTRRPALPSLRTPDPQSDPAMPIFRRFARVSRPPDRYGSYHTSFSTALSSISVPSSYSDAVKHECWQQAMQMELQALQKKPYLGYCSISHPRLSLLDVNGFIL